jgi:hypothetical protein
VALFVFQAHQAGRSPEQTSRDSPDYESTVQMAGGTSMSLCSPGDDFIVQSLPKTCKEAEALLRKRVIAGTVNIL